MKLHKDARPATQREFVEHCHTTAGLQASLHVMVCCNFSLGRKRCRLDIFVCLLCASGHAFGSGCTVLHAFAVPSTGPLADRDRSITPLVQRRSWFSQRWAHRVATNPQPLRALPISDKAPCNTFKTQRSNLPSFDTRSQVSANFSPHKRQQAVHVIVTPPPPLAPGLVKDCSPPSSRQCNPTLAPSPVPPQHFAPFAGPSFPPCLAHNRPPWRYGTEA